MDEKFKEILNEVNPEILESGDVDLVEEGILDSLLIMMLVSKVEAAYSFCFDPDEIDPENFASAESIWKMVEKKGGKN